MRLEAIDVARGLAALSVAIYHNGFGTALSQVTGQSLYGVIDWPGARFAVPVFFVISGFCIHLGWLGRKQDEGFVRRFFIQRFFRIYPPWVVAVMVSAMALWLTGGQPTTGQLVSHLTLTNGFFDDYRLNAALWSVSVESFLYLLYPLWLVWRRRYGLVTACALALVVNVTSGTLTAMAWPYLTGPSQWFFLNVWCGWLAGAVLAELLYVQRERLLGNVRWWSAGVLAWGLHLAAKVTGVYLGAAAFADIPVMIVLCIWPLALLLRVGAWLEARPPTTLTAGWHLASRIGLFSYSLYLLHIPLQSVRFVLNAHLVTLPAKAMLMLVWFGVILAISWLSYRWIEVPFAQWGRRLAARVRPPPAIPVPAPLT